LWLLRNSRIRKQIRSDILAEGFHKKHSLISLLDGEPKAKKQQSVQTEASGKKLLI